MISFSLTEEVLFDAAKLNFFSQPCKLCPLVCMAGQAGKDPAVRLYITLCCGKFQRQPGSNLQDELIILLSNTNKSTIGMY